MDRLIVYATKYGCTRRCAELLASGIRGGARLAELGAAGSGRRGRSEMEEMLGAAAVVVIGGPIYAGRIRPAVGRFCEGYRELLLGRKVALFICGLERGDRAREELESAFPAWLSAHAFSRRVLGGEVRLDSLRPLDRFLFTRVARGAEDVSRIERGEIESLAGEIDSLGGA